MRPSAPALGDMPGGKAYGLWWGDKSVLRMRGVTQYAISPFQGRVAPRMFQNYLFNGYRRLSKEVFYFVVPFATGYGIYAWAKRTDAYQNSKAGHLASGHAH